MKAIILSALCALVYSVQIRPHTYGLAQVEQKAKAESYASMASEAQIFIFDDIFMWIFCKLTTCEKKEAPKQEDPPKKEEPAPAPEPKKEEKPAVNESNSSNSTNATASTAATPT